jgi:dTDP-4-dehydrorhamnose 3,5-epimerase
VEILETSLPGVLLIKPRVFGDARGFFLETWAAERYERAGVSGPFVQDNLSRSSRGVLRGLHLQHPFAQGKLVSVADGEVFDVCADVRAGSPTFGKWYGCHLSGENHHQLYIPPGFVHGFCVLRDDTLFSYKCTVPYHPEAELGVRWDDPDLGITWPLADPIVSAKDSKLARLAEIDTARLPSFR